MPKKPTKAETVEALDSCIRRWNKIAKGETGSRGTRHCALCQLYVLKNGDCRGCPIKAVTGEDGCKGTPFANFILASKMTLNGFMAKSDTAKVAATVMHNFLKAVRTGFGPKTTTRKERP